MSRILVVGAGAVGGYFGGRLAQAGRDVTFLVRGRRAEQLRESGLEIVGPSGDATVKPDLVTAGELVSGYDIVLLAVKHYALDAAIRDVTPAVGEDTVIVPLLNGMRHLERLTAAFGARHVFGGVCLVATTLDDDGRVIQLRDMQEISYGELDGSATPRLEAVDVGLRGAGFVARASAHIVLEMWEKWVFIAALNGMTVLMRGSVGEIEAAPRGRELALALLDECASVATAQGFAPRAEGSLARSRAVLTESGSRLTSSLYRDLLQGAPLEADAIVGDMCDRGLAARLRLPLLSAVYAQLHIQEARRRALHGLP
jgi:2-dehydropantoate 2-reductase